MKPTGIFLLAAGALVGYLGDVPALEACTAVLKPVEEVIRESEVIVRARVVGPGVSLQVLEVLKGSYDRPFVSVTGQIRDYRSDPRRRPPMSRSTAWGACRDARTASPGATRTAPSISCC